MTKMTYDVPSPDSEPPIGGDKSVSREEQGILDELVEVLSTHPRGRGRWSVMRAIRAGRAKRGRDIPHKLEDEVERTFRRHCSNSPGTHSAAPGRVLFHRPKETAGEVWAIVPAAVAIPPAGAPHLQSANKPA